MSSVLMTDRRWSVPPSLTSRSTHLIWLFSLFRRDARHPRAGQRKELGVPPVAHPSGVTSSRVGTRLMCGAQCMC